MIRDDRGDLVYRTAQEKWNAVVEEIRECAAAGPAGAGRHGVDREERDALEAAQPAAARCRTWCSTPSTTSARPRSSPRPAARARSPSPPTWPAAAPTSSSAATPRGSPAPRPTRRPSPRRTRRRSRATARPAPASARRCSPLGGLHILGTERHESRRIDNQLRGRSGRQGDPGSSRFYLSLEDDLMRIFGSDRIQGLMGTPRHGRGRGDRAPHGLARPSSAPRRRSRGGTSRSASTSSSTTT